MTSEDSSKRGDTSLLNVKIGTGRSVFPEESAEDTLTVGDGGETESLLSAFPGTFNWFPVDPEVDSVARERECEPAEDFLEFGE